MKNYSFVLLAFVSMQVMAQSSFQQRYATAKDFFKDGKYNLAMEAFKPLIPYDQANPYSEYASYYYALSAYRQGYRSVAKDMFTQIRSVHPEWSQLDEVNLWLARIHFENRDHFQALHMLDAVKNPRLRKEITVMKRAAIDSLHDAEILRMMLEKYPDDAVIGEQLVRTLANDLRDPQNMTEFETLCDKLHLRKADYKPATPVSIHKSEYRVAVLFPFLVNTLEPTTTRKRNQFVLDLYEGMRMAVDTLKTMGVAIRLEAYDTERNPDKLKALLEKEELKAADLLVGPLFSEENKAVQDFSFANKINLFNPISGNSDLVANNPYGFLFQPSLETIGKRSAEYVLADPANKTCMVFYGESKRDSTLAAAFLNRAKDSGLRVKLVQRLGKDNTRKILEILQTPTEYDEFKYPSQFTLPKDSLDCIYVASDDPLIYAKVIGSVETRRDDILVIGSENWLDQTSVSYSKYQTLRIALAAPSVSRADNAWYHAFLRSFIRRHGRVSGSGAYSDYSKIGYEFMLFAGFQLKNNGVYFQEALQRETFIPGYVSEGFSFTNAKDNQHVPFIRFESGSMTVQK